MLVRWCLQRDTAIAIPKVQLMTVPLEGKSELADTAMAGAIENANGLFPEDIDIPLNQRQSPTINNKL